MNIDKQALRKVAEKAQAARARLESFPDEDGVLFEDDDIKSDVSACNKFFVLATPATMLALLDELEAETRYREGAFIACNRWHDKFREADDKLEAAERRIEELERSETQLINERDSAESALNDAYKAVMGQAPEWSNWFSFENAIDEIELVCELWRNQTDDVIQFRQRIQELEAKLETADRLQDSAFRDGLKAGFSYGQTDDQSGFTQCMSAYSPRTGIGVKQQQDSVDSDVGSRNQPGMVVAIHIDAGDFVKVKGKVFEVEETDFDDHDVTLWFVGGNVLKCAAGCPVEVVSAPVAAGIKVKGE
ncbi:ead/Ea22-like family protein [Salmonella enterica subsp. houtenae]|uniref:Ead/Ea22-like family protein n=1 Tax=Salmonella enterica TaxID=28901 RepID=A0A743NF00_SALER|nr:ead/Ea22-like family protein [Salmonella enterica subsp. houtenae]HAF2098067.1 ead/Ea22-like family protein [Salmonella enterica]